MSLGGCGLFSHPFYSETLRGNFYDGYNFSSDEKASGCLSLSPPGIKTCSIKELLLFKKCVSKRCSLKMFKVLLVTA